MKKILVQNYVWLRVVINQMDEIIIPSNRLKDKKQVVIKLNKFGRKFYNS
jgi:hypothetical protein